MGYVVDYIAVFNIDDAVAVDIALAEHVDRVFHSGDIFLVDPAAIVKICHAELFRRHVEAQVRQNVRQPFDIRLRDQAVAGHVDVVIYDR